MSLFCLPKTQAQTGELNHASYQLCFTPGGHCTSLIVHTIGAAKKSVDVQAYSFTSTPIVRALVAAKARGVHVFVLLDKSNVGMPYAAIAKLREGHVSYLIDAKPEIAHNKVMIMDNATVITGSFNFTKAAQNYYAENVLVIHDAQLASYYTQNFLKRQQASESIRAYCYPVTPLNAALCHQQAVLFQHIERHHPWRQMQTDLDHQSAHLWQHV